MGYIVMSAFRSEEPAEFFAPLSYGRGAEPAHEQLVRRNRATIFSTKEEACLALESTLKLAKEKGATWPDKFQYIIIEAELKDNP